MTTLRKRKIEQYLRRVDRRPSDRLLEKRSSNLLLRLTGLLQYCIKERHWGIRLEVFKAKPTLGLKHDGPRYEKILIAIKLNSSQRDPLIS